MICEKCNKMCKPIFARYAELMVCPTCHVVYCPLVVKDG
jgi:hypothetical protein